MKLKSIITTIFLALTFTAFSQTIPEKKFEFGIAFSPTLTFSQRFDRTPALNYSTGIYTKYQFLKKLGIGVGFNYQTQIINTTAYVNCDPIGNLSICEAPFQNKFDLIQIPVWLSLNMNYKSNPKVRADLIGGYGFGKLLYSMDREKAYGLWDLVDNLHFGMVGIEFQRKILGDVKLTLGSHLEVTNIYNKRYGDIQNVKIVLRVSK